MHTCNTWIWHKKPTKISKNNVRKIHNTTTLQSSSLARIKSKKPNPKTWKTNKTEGQKHNKKKSRKSEPLFLQQKPQKRQYKNRENLKRQVNISLRQINRQNKTKMPKRVSSRQIKPTRPTLPTSNSLTTLQKNCNRFLFLKHWPIKMFKNKIKILLLVKN